MAVWIGALAGFAFVFAPLAFHTVTNVAQFARLVAASIHALTLLGLVCGAIAVAMALVRGRSSAQRWSSPARALLIAAAVGFAAYDAYAIVPHMEHLVPRTAAYRALHDASSRLYGGALLLATVALVLAVLDGRIGAKEKPRHAS
ncbi:MAG: DUF4149 domain-containing protein [Candidatus Eremiobacteraeota bacterium]|nr:DUF4149 domain-containing protein [Candidatus Eremiobacteraeota bacterium]